MTLEQWEKVLRANPSEINEKRLKNIPSIKKQSRLKKGFQYGALTQSYKNYLLAELRGERVARSCEEERRSKAITVSRKGAVLNPAQTVNSLPRLKDFTVEVTFGAKTKYYRTKLGLSKSQINDALVIASEGKFFEMPQYYHKTLRRWCFTYWRDKLRSDILMIIFLHPKRDNQLLNISDSQ